MSNSPVNFLGLAAGAAGLMAGRKAKKSRGKIKKRVSKLENQIEAIQRKENGTDMPQDQTVAAQPLEMETQAETMDENQPSLAQQMVRGGMNQNSNLALSTIASPFSPSTQQAAGGMFGAQVPGSFDRDMGEEDTY
tara:strand:+ start:22 stop:429 length:408 start_codon:yes stop_codon:yes gene_type:complete